MTLGDLLNQVQPTGVSNCTTTSKCDSDKNNGHCAGGAGAKNPDCTQNPAASGSTC